MIARGWQSPTFGYAEWSIERLQGLSKWSAYSSLTTYSLAKRLARRPETADLVPHVDDMRRAPGVRRKSKPQPETPVPTAFRLGHPAGDGAKGAVIGS